MPGSTAPAAGASCTVSQRLGVGLDVGAGDDAALTGAGDLVEVDAEVLGVLADRGLGQRPTATLASGMGDVVRPPDETGVEV